MNRSTPPRHVTPLQKLITAITACCLLLMLEPRVASAKSDAGYLAEVNAYLGQGEHRSAIIVLKNALQENPDDAIARNTLGKTYLTTGDVTSAEKELSKAHRLDPENIEIRINYARALFQAAKFKKIEPLVADTDGWPPERLVEAYALQAQVKTYHGDLEQAEKILLTASQIDEKHPDVLFAQALLKAQGRQLDEAEKYLDQLLRQRPDHTQGLLLRGEVALAKKDYKIAIKSFDEINRSQENNWLAKLKLAQALYEDDQLDEASKQLKAILSVVPHNATANYMQALVGLKQKDYEKAAIHAEATLLEVGNHLESLYIAAVANYSQNRYEAAYQHINMFLKNLPNHVESIKLKAALELKMGLADKASSTFSKIDSDAFEQKDAELMVAAGLASLQSGDYDRGKLILQRATPLSSDPRIHLAQASIALRERDSETAIAELKKAIEQDAGGQDAKIALILSYLQAQQPEQALEAAAQFSQAHPDNPHVATLEGMAYGMNKEIDKAESAFRKALAIDPGNPNASHNLATLVMARQEVAKARGIYEAVVEHYPGDLKALLKLSLIDQKAGEHQQAVLWLEQAIETHPDALPPRLLLSELYLRQNKPAQALTVSEQALPSHPDNLDLLMLLGDAQRFTGQHAQAINTFEKLSQLAPDTFLPHYRLATLYETTGQLPLAQDAVTEALAINPGHQGALYMRGRIAVQVGDTKAANLVVTQLQKSVPDTPAITELQAHIALASDRPAEAVKLYRKVLTERENNFMTIQLASALWQQEERQDAIATLAQWINRYPEDLLTMNVLANFYLLDDQLEEARDQFDRIVQLTPGNAMAQNNLAWLLLKEGRVDAALIHAQQARKIAPNNPDVMDTLGMVLLNQGNYRGAERLFMDAADLVPQDLNVQFHLAQASAKIGETEKAENILTQILSRENSKGSFAYREAAEYLLDELRRTKLRQKGNPG